jgi:hypothetical protein
VRLRIVAAALFDRRAIGFHRRFRVPAPHPVQTDVMKASG